MASTQVHVPKRYVQAFRFLGEIEDEQANAIEKEAGRQPRADDLDDLASRLDALEVEGLDASLFVRALTTLYLFMDLHGEDEEALVQGLSESLQTDRGFSEEVASAASRRAGRMLAMHDTLGLLAKEDDVATECDHLFCSARVLTDLRPVFPRDIGKKATAWHVLHTLRVSVHVDGDNRESETFSVTMDTKGLDRLETIIARARAKEVAIREQLGGAIQILTAKGHR